MDHIRPTVEVRNVTKFYEDRPAVVDITFDARPAQVTGLLGPNGAGKTTLIRIVTTVLQPTSGTFTVAGYGPDRPASLRSRIGVMPESAGYPKRKRAVDYLRFYGRLYGLPDQAADTRAHCLLEQVGLEARRSDRIGNFSRGMRQRLGLARALINDPGVLFLDEPTLGLDPIGKREILDLIRRLADDRAAAVILTSHLLDEIERICDRAVILKDGMIVHDGPVSSSLAETFLAATS